MIIALGVDHGGFPLKNIIIKTVQQAGHEVLDLGTFSTNPVDYPDYAKAVGEAVLDSKAQRGIVVCGSGAGACMAANKLPGIRAALCHDSYTAHQAVEHDDMNVLCLGARVIGPELAAELVRSFLAAKFSAEARHVRRLNMMAELEQLRK